MKNLLNKVILWIKWEILFEIKFRFFVPKLSKVQKMRIQFNFDKVRLNNLERDLKMEEFLEFCRTGKYP